MELGILDIGLDIGYFAGIAFHDGGDGFGPDLHGDCAAEMVLSGPDFAATISQHPLAGASHPDSGIAFGEQKVRLTRWGAVALIDSFLSAIHLSAQSKVADETTIIRHWCNGRTSRIR
jgi:hypothetical protein